METLVLSHTSALRAIRAYRRKYYALPWNSLGKVEQRKILKASSPNAGPIDFDYLSQLGFWEGLPSEKLDILVGSPTHRTKRPKTTCHVMTRTLPGAAIMHVTDNIYASSPAFTALLYSKGRSVPAILALLLELLGTYTLPEDATLPIAWGGYWPDKINKDDVQQTHYHCDPAVSLADLQAMADWAASSTYCAFRQAVKIAATGSASPMESVMYGMFAAPIARGGFNFAGLPEGGMLLNERIDFSHDAALMASGMPYAIADAYIPAANTDFEYNGAGHEEEQARVHDGQRNNGMRGMGIKVIVINRDQMQNLDALEAIARSVYRDAGVRFRQQGSEHRLRQANLLNGLRSGMGLKPV